MSIIYSLIAIEPDIVLSEYTEFQGNFMLISRIVLQKYNKSHGDRIEIVYDQYRFYIYSIDHVRLMIMTEGNAGDIPNAFSCLKDVYAKLLKSFDYEHLIQLNAYQLEFREQLKEMVMYYNTFPIKTRDGVLVRDVDIAKNVVTVPITAMIEKESISKIIVIKNKDKEKDDNEIEMFNISSAVNQIKNEDNDYDSNALNNKRSKSYMIIASGITALLILFYYLI